MPFLNDITPYLNADGSENTIAVHVVNQQPSSRWYSGSGIYRDVKLSVTDKVHVAKYGTTITSPKLEEQKNGAVDTLVKSRIVNQDDQAHSIYAEYEIVDQNGQVVSEKVRSEVQSVLAGQEINLPHTLHVEKPTSGMSKPITQPLYSLYSGLSRFAVGRCAKRTFWLPLSELDTRRWLLPQWSGYEIPRCFPSP